MWNTLTIDLWSDRSKKRFSKFGQRDARPMLCSRFVRSDRALSLAVTHRRANSRALGPNFDKGRQGQYIALVPYSVVQKRPEGDAKFSARLFETRKSVATAPAFFAASAAADLSALHKLPNITFAQVVMQRKIGAFKHQQQLAFVVTHAFERQAKRDKASLGRAKRVKSAL